MSDENKKDIRWPRKEHLIEALEVFDAFRNACKYQLDMGYWMTVTFPSKHHLNKILSVQYIDENLRLSVYGEGLTRRLLETIPLCKSYAAFTRADHVEKNQK